MKAKHFLGWCS